MKKNNLKLLSELKFLADKTIDADNSLEKSLTKKELLYLRNNNLIYEKNNSYQLNFVGNVWKEKISLLQFLEKHSDYFISHDFGDASDSLLRQLEQLTKSRLVSGVWPNSTLWKKIASESDKFLYCILFQPPFLLGDVISEKLSQGIELRLLFGKNSDIPDCNDLIEKLELNKIKSYEGIKRRIVENIGINIIMSDKESSLMFPECETADMHNSFVSSDPDFLRWCMEFFSYKWNDGADFSRLRITS